MTIQLDFGGYELRLDRSYDPDTHLWVQQAGDGRVRVGFDALTADTYGALAQLLMSPIGTTVQRGEEFGSLEAAKFVGPLTAPVSGVLAAVNDAVLADPEGMLRRLCEAIGIGWDPAMLAWEEGPHPQDGVWGAHWYDRVNRSTGFAEAPGAMPRLEGDYARVAQACTEDYAWLLERSLRPAPR